MGQRTSQIIVSEFEKNNKRFWNEILYQEKLMTDIEADEMVKITKEFRKERGYRDEPGF